MRERKTLKLQHNEALQAYNTLALQAHASAFVTVNNDDEVLEALAWAKAHKLPVVPWGAGSNVVLAGALPALVLRLASRGIELLSSDHEHACVRVAAGESWHTLVQWCVSRGYFGLQNLALIPGTVGAAPIQNIGAYGVELQSVLQRVHARQIIDGRAVVLEKADCAFHYRDSVFKQELKDQLVITAIDLQLRLQPTVDISYPALADYFGQNPAIEATPQTVFDAVVNIRRAKLPSTSDLPNAGSFFKNPVVARALADKLVAQWPAIPVFMQPDGEVKLAAAWMIDQCGWKGFRCNGQGVHAQHALVLVNYGNADGAQLLALAHDITESVKRKFHVSLEIEPRVYGMSSD